MKRVDELNLTELVAGKNETAFGVLLTSTGTQIERIDPNADADENLQRVKNILDQ